MIIVNTISALQNAVNTYKKEGKQVGLVPTMGALHNGHLTLIKQAKAENDIVVCSIFVNPVQFNNQEDLEKYPRLPEQDIALIQNYCDICFMPSVEEMYPTPPTEKYDFGQLEQVMEGAMRPGHFNGVGIVVNRLFHMVQPHRAYFGKKDFQQLVIIQHLVKTEHLNIEIRPVEIVRAEDGLALSSRNQRLSEHARKEAPFIYRTLQAAKANMNHMSVPQLQAWIEQQFATNTNFELEYVQIVNGETLQPVHNYDECSSIVICITAWIDNVRLIDNITLK